MSRSLSARCHHEHRPVVPPELRGHEEAVITEASDGSAYRRALALMTSSSLLVPLVGLATAPILAQALGVAGRGEAAAALAPNALVVSIATLGLPEALTFHLARTPHTTRRSIAWASGLSLVAGLVCLAIVALLSSVLASGDDELATLITLGTALAVPMLVVNLLRGAASGRQLWAAVAGERVLNSLLRLVALGGLAIANELTVERAVIVMGLAPVVAGIVYFRLFMRPPVPDSPAEPPPRMRRLMSFGARIWLGSVASMVLGRLGQLLMTPLAGVGELGLFVVAITVADVPFIVATALRDTVFGVESHAADPNRLATTCRVATWVALCGSIGLGATLPFWIAPLFGSDFEAAVLPTWLLLIATVLNIPGLIVGGGLGAADRPGLRSIAMAIALTTNVILFVALVPTYGAVGAGVSGIVGALAASGFAVGAAARLLRVPVSAFLIPRGTDLVLLRTEIGRLRRRRRPGRGGEGSSA